MTCAELKARLSDFARGRLTPEATAEIKAHLEDCDACAKAAKVEKAFHSALQVTIRESDPEEAELLSVAAGYRAPSKRWKVNAIALLVGIGLSAGLILLFDPGISFEDVLAMHHHRATAEGQALEATGGRAELEAWLRARLDFAPSLPDELAYEGARIVRIQMVQAAQLIVRTEADARVSIFILSPVSLDGFGNLAGRLGDRGSTVGTFQGETVAVIRSRLLVALAGRLDPESALRLLSPFRGL